MTPQLGGYAESDPARAADNPAAMVLLVDDQLMIAEALRRALADAANINFHCAKVNTSS